MAHLDPDLVASVVKRLPGWRGMFGQSNAAASHLLNHQVGTGDLFLFFGRFRDAERVDGRLSPAHVQDMHAIWGYMLVGEILEGSRKTCFPAWALRHPHTQECFPGFSCVQAQPDLHCYPPPFPERAFPDGAFPLG